MAGPESTGKQKAARISLDYYKKPDALRRWTRWLTVVAVVAAVGWWLGMSLLRGDHGRLLYSRGPVASVHAAWDAECWACHESFRPMNESASFGKLLGLNPHASDQLCTNCHAGPPHSERQIASEVQSCGSCHRDHRGRDASLVHLADSDCTRCHADLKAHVAKPPAEYENVTRFAAGKHPAFRSIKADPGRLSFNHKMHLMAGMDDPTHPVKREATFPFTLAQIPEEERERYRLPGQNKANDATNKVQLNCQSCHQLDSGDYNMQAGQLSDLPGGAVLPPRSAGTYMLPIVYENECKACHPLTIEKGTKETKPLTVPHRLQPDQVHTFLQDAFLNRYLAKDRDKLLAQPFVPPSRVRPGKEPSKLPDEQLKVRDEMAQWVKRREEFLFVGKTTCGECHQYNVKNDTPMLEQIKLDAVPEFKIEAPQIPNVWLKHGRFNHASHRAVDCRGCHAGADTSTVSGDVLIPTMDNCLQCHAPASTATGKAQGGVRFDCTECHNYHHGGAVLQGLGAAARKPKRELSIQEFLSGQR
jgi:hypothetical protein